MQHNHKSHGIWMIICCLVPIVLIAALYSLNIGSPAFRTLLGGLLLLLCPLAHVVMMLFMFKGNNNNNSNHDESQKSCH